MPSLITQFWEARNPPADPTHLSFKGKTVLVTGASSGMGFNAAMKYAQPGASKLILAVRSKEKGEAAKTSIIQSTSSSADNIVVMTVDLSTFASVTAFCRRVNEEIGELHVVLLCAGVMMPRFTLGPEGYELNLQVNVLSTALMALLLLPKVRDTGARSAGRDGDGGGGDPAHLCFLNSLATQEVDEKMIPPGDWSLIERINDSSSFDHFSQYYLVKLAARYFMRGMADACGEDENVVINCCCPALCRTNLHQNYDLFTRVVAYPYKLLCGRTAEQGARTLVSATGLGRESHGRLWLNDDLPPPAMFLATERSEQLYHRTFDELMTILRENANFDATTLPSIADAVVGVLSWGFEETRNRSVCIQDVQISQGKLAKGQHGLETFRPYLWQTATDPEFGSVSNVNDNVLLGLKGKTEEAVLEIIKGILAAKAKAA